MKTFKSSFGSVYVPEYSSIYYNKDVYDIVVKWLVGVYKVSLLYSPEDVSGWTCQLYVPESIIKEYGGLVNETEITLQLQKTFEAFINTQHYSLSITNLIENIVK